MKPVRLRPRADTDIDTLVSNFTANI